MQEAGSTLVISSHGGYFARDLHRPPVILPVDASVKFLVPHNTHLEDPGLHRVVNAPRSFESYLTIYNEAYQVNFSPQRHKHWLFARDYNPRDRINVLGGEEGLFNYRHSHFSEEDPKYIAQVILENRLMAAQGQATLTDVLVVNNKISFSKQTNLLKASVQRVFDLDASGELINAAGERYNTFVFAHCRANLLLPDTQVSLYKVAFPRPQKASLVASRLRIFASIYSRSHTQAPFTLRTEEVGDMSLIPLASKSVGIAQ